MPEGLGTSFIGERPMRLLLFIDGLGSGGAQRQFVQLALGLVRRGHQITVAVYNNQDHFAADLTAAGIAIVPLPKPSRFSLRPVFALARLCRAQSAEVIIAFLRSPAFKAELVRLMVPGLKVIAAERTIYPDPPLPLSLRAVQTFHWLASFVTVNSARQAEAMKREFPRLASRVVVIRNGVDVPAQFTARHAEDKTAVRLLAISSLMPYKNSVRLAEAVALVRDSGLDVSVSWLGETFENMPGYGAYHDTVERIRALGIKDRWRWLGVTRDVPSVLAAHDALIHPSLYEGTSNAVCEAMATGLPVLAGPIADHPEMLGETEAGILFDPLDAQSIANGIARFADLGPDERAKMGARGRAVIESRYSVERMVSDYEALAMAAAREGSAAATGSSPVHQGIG